jgi:formate hydrogenlyase subunit 3/multisubunit Na+/H+ antiporter MnhD subunit
MFSHLIPDFFWIAAAIEILGLASAMLVRLTEGSPSQAACQAIFFAVMLLVGVASLAALSAGLGHWFVLGSTLAVMVLMATLDFGGRDRAQA